MKKNSWIVAAAALLLGAAGWYLRRQQLAYGFETDSRFAIAGDRWALFLVSLAFVAVAAALIAAFLLQDRRCTAYDGGRRCIGALLPAAGSLLLLLGGVLRAVELARQGGLNRVTDLVFVILCVACGIIMLVFATRKLLGGEPGRMKSALLLLPVFYCYWLVILYKENAANPVLLEYCFEAVALACSCISFYFTAGIVNGKKGVRAFLFFHMLAIFFLMTDLAGTGGARLLMQAGTVLLLLYQLSSLIWLPQLYRSRKRQREQ